MRHALSMLRQQNEIAPCRRFVLPRPLAFLSSIRSRFLFLSILAVHVKERWMNLHVSYHVCYKTCHYDEIHVVYTETVVWFMVSHNSHWHCCSQLTLLFCFVVAVNLKWWKRKLWQNGITSPAEPHPWKHMPYDILAAMWLMNENINTVWKRILSEGKLIEGSSTTAPFCTSSHQRTPHWVSCQKDCEWIKTMSSVFFSHNLRNFIFHDSTNEILQILADDDLAIQTILLLSMLCSHQGESHLKTSFPSIIPLPFCIFPPWRYRGSI
jgi:hypothetical protein